MKKYEWKGKNGICRLRLGNFLRFSIVQEINYRGERPFKEPYAVFINGTKLKVRARDIPAGKKIARIFARHIINRMDNDLKEYELFLKEGEKENESG